jgi:hypothetical protein
MGTRSSIIVKVKKEDIGNRVLTHEFKGKKYKTKIEKPYIGIYCHWDGYPDGVGATLFEDYNDYEKVLDLISGGFASSICGEEADYYMAWNRNEEWKDNKPRQNDEVKVCGGWTEYAYIFDNGKWYVGIVEGENDTIEDVVELTEEVIENGHPSERDL